MASQLPLQRSRWSLIGTALLGLVATAAAGPPPVIGPLATESGQSFDQGLEEFSMLSRAAKDLRVWAWSSTAPAAEPVTTLVDALLAAAMGERDAEAWERAHAASSILEASLRVSGSMRFDLAVAARELGALAPNEALRVHAVRAEVRLLESVIASSIPSMGEGQLSGSRGAGESPQLRARARIDEILGRREHVETGSTGTAPGPFVERLERRIRTLAVGQPLPRFLARDTAGNEVRSSLLPGRITVFRLWESSSPGSMLAHERDARLDRTFWNAPVSLFGATHSNSRDEHLAQLDARVFAGTQLFDGPISTALEDELARAGDSLTHGAGWSAPVSFFDAWARPAAGSVFVVDELGVIRGRDLLGDELESLVSHLVAERRARLRGLSEGRFTTRTSR